VDNLITNTKKNSPQPDLSFLLHFSKGAKSRKRILNKLIYCTKSCNHLATDLGLNWRTAYRHLKILEKESLVKSFDFGERKFYELTLKGEKVTKIPLNTRQL
jgi:predicted transcriptional regulator